MNEIAIGTKYKQIFLMDINKPAQKTKIGGGNEQRVVQLAYETDFNLLFATQKGLYEIDEQSQEIMTIQRFSNQQNCIGFLHSCQHSYVSALSSGKIIRVIEQNEEKYGQIIFKKQWTKQFNKGKQPIYKKMVSYDPGYCFLIGKNTPPLIFDLNFMVVTWEGKNVANDQLDLQVPINDVDAGFFQYYTPFVLNADRKLRLYDTRNNKRRPIIDSQLAIATKQRMTVSQKSVCGNYVYLGTDVGAIYESDRRKNLQITGKFKSQANSTITTLKAQSNLLLSGELSGNVRIFDIESKGMQRKIYLNRPISCIYIKDNPLQLFDLEEDTGKKVEKVKKIRKRNKVGISYLRAQKQALKQQQQL